MEWRVYVSGSDLDLEILRQEYAAGGTVQLLRDGYRPYLSVEGSGGLDGIPEFGRKMVDEANVVGRLADHRFTLIELLGTCGTDGVRQFVTASGTYTALPAEGAYGPPGSAASLKSRGESKPPLPEVFDLLARAPQLDWVTLYKVYELLREEAGGEKPLKLRTGATSRQIASFAGSANNRSVSGWEARHAVDQGGPPRHTMGLPEARQFILGLVRSW